MYRHDPGTVNENDGPSRGPLRRMQRKEPTRRKSETIHPPFFVSVIGYGKPRDILACCGKLQKEPANDQKLVQERVEHPLTRGSTGEMGAGDCVAA